jgi:Flp pilus assembly protein TadD
MPIVSRTCAVAVLVAALCGSTTAPAQEASATSESSPAVRALERSVFDRVESDGSASRRERFRVRILTAGGLAQYSQVGVAFLEASQEAKISVLRVTKPAGGQLDLLASAPTDVAPVLPSDLPIYSDLRMLRAAVPALAIGDELEFESIVLSRPIAPGQVWIETAFAEAEKVELQTYVLDTPADARLTVSVREGLAARFEEEHADGRWIRHWRVDAVPGVAPHPVPASASATPDIQITTFRSWDEFGRWWASLAPPHSDAKIRAKALELTRGIAEPEARLRALHRYIAQEIRYLALPLGIGRYRAREPDEILTTGLGDCKDKFRLLASMAESVGITVDPVLIFAGAERAFAADAPSPLQFDHVVARARIGSAEIWMDPTAELVPMGSLPRSSRGRPGVALLASGKEGRSRTAAEISSALVTTPAELPQPATMDIEITGALAASGLLRAKVRWTFSGDDEILRALFKYGDEKTRRAVLESMHREWRAGAKVENFSNSDPNEFDRPLWVEYDVERSLPEAAWRKAWELWVPTPLLALPAPPEPGKDDKTVPPQPLELKSTARQRIFARIELPPGVQVSPPVPISSRRDFAEFRSNYRLDGDSLILERELRILSDSIAPAAFPDLRELTKLIVSDYAQEFGIAAAPALAPVEHSATELGAECWEALDQVRNADAERLCREAIALDPKLEDVWNGLGLALERQSRIDEAKAAYEKQIEVDPRHGYAYANLGLLAWNAGDTNKAEKLLRQQIEIAPLVAFGYGKLGRLLAGGERLDEAESLLRRAAKLDPEEVEVFEDLLALQAQRGRFDAVAAMLAERPTLGRQVDRMARIFTSLAAQESAIWRSLRGWLQGVVTEAENLLAGLKTLPPSREQVGAVARLAAAWQGLAGAAREEGRPEEALALASAAIEVGHHPSAIAERSAVQRVLGKTAAANLDLAIAAELARPYGEEFEVRLAQRVPDAGAREVLARRAQEESWRFRSIARKATRAAGDQGEIWLLFDADGGLRRAVPCSGSKTRTLAAELERAPFRLPLPPANRASLPIKALAYCGQDGECTLTLEPPGQSWMSMPQDP